MTLPADNRAGGAALAESQAIAAESVLAAMFLYAMDVFAHLRLTAPGFIGLAAGWVLCRAAAGALRRLSRLPDWIVAGWELGGPALWVGLASPHLRKPWTLPQVVYAGFFIWLVWRLWRWGLQRSAAKGSGESLRWLLLGGVSLAAVAPYFTDLQLGGRDANWYTSVFIDFIQQLRAGFFPVFVGQGELSYNGSANLFRSAPLCLWIGGIWDWLTWQSLSPVAIRNLSILTAAVGAGVSMYAALVRLLGKRYPERAAEEGARWMASGVALLYVLCPGVLIPLYYYELQMTFTALLALPWIVYGNLCVMQAEKGGGEVALAAGLAMAWMAHPPLAIISTFGTAAMQIGRLAFVPVGRAEVMSLAKVALLFVLLSAYYFLSMSELSSLTTPQLKSDVLVLLAVVLTVAGVVQAFYHQRWPWLAAVACGAGLVGWQHSPWLGWIVAWTGLFGVTVLILRWRGRMPDTPRMVLVGAATMLLAAAAAQPWAVAQGYLINEPMAKALAELGKSRGEFLQPLLIGKFGSCQPGYGLWLLAVLLLGAAPWLRNEALSLVASLAAFFVAIILRVPLVSDFIVHYAPPEFGVMVAFPLPYRIMAPLAALVGVGGFAVLLRWPRGRRGKAVGYAGLLLAVAWSAGEARKILVMGGTLRKSRAETARVFSPDNYALGRYAYLMLYTPLHYMDGKRLPLLESRLLTPHYDMLAGPEQLARRFEAVHEAVHPLASRIDPDYPVWRWITPRWDVQPGETLLLRFEFDPTFNPHGWLILESRNGYQEHLLDPTFGGAGFGAGPIASRVIAVTNSGNHTEHYVMKMKIEPANTLPLDGGQWGRLHISRYVVEQAPVQLESLLPYRARVVMSENGYLESPRQWLAGYRGWVDGRPVEPVRLKSGMLGVPLPEGVHTVVLEFAGSERLWFGLVLSVTTALVLLLHPLLAVAGGYEHIRRAWLRWLEGNRA